MSPSIRVQGMGCSSPRCRPRKFSKEEFFDGPNPVETKTSVLTSESPDRSFGRRKRDVSYEVRVLWERIVVAVHTLSTMWEEVHWKGRLGPVGFHYRCAGGAYRNRLADYLAREQGGTGSVLTLKVAEVVHGPGDGLSAVATVVKKRRVEAQLSNYDPRADPKAWASNPSCYLT